jgi:hypothetical protein
VGGTEALRAGESPLSAAREAADPVEEVIISLPIQSGDDSSEAPDLMLHIPRVWLEEEAAAMGGEAMVRRDYDAAALPFPLPIGRLLRVWYNGSAWAGEEEERAHRASVRTWRDLLEYNKAFLLDKLRGTFYHRGPLIADQSSLELLAVHDQGVLTKDGQGRLLPSAADAEEDPDHVVLIVMVDGKDRCFVEARRPTFYAAQAVATFQRAYLSALVPRRLVQRIITGLLAEVDEVWGSIVDMSTH